MILMFASLMPSVAAKTSNERKQFTLVVDPGHGGKDMGAVDNNAREKDINLGVALQLETLIKKKMKDAKIVMTRNNDTYLTDLHMRIRAKEMAVSHLKEEVANERRLDSIGSGTGDRIREAELAYS
ncbi:MAG: N-acetylmuramoyl-L-alanine amidase, partial [Muribaculaceae bacterium]|nr:N-acetylmuramoyl-L-alanine amidase [Muribaculaceae bacterium]